MRLALASPSRCTMITAMNATVTKFKAFKVSALVAIAALSSMTSPAQALDQKVMDALVPHKALYEIKMVSKDSGSQIVNISGQMFYEWRPECEAWVTDHRFNLMYEYADSAPMKITSDFSTYETFDGKEFNFSSRRKRNGELYQELRGIGEFPVAEEASSDTGGEAVYSMPDGLIFDLDQGVLFPMAHTVKVLEYAEAGKRFFHATIFDGSDEEGPVEINTFIGDRVNAMARLGEGNTNLDTTLINTPARKVRMAFFPLAEPNADAEYEMDVVFHDNGIISDMLVEYRDFSVTQKLVALEKLPENDCTDR